MSAQALLQPAGVEPSAETESIAEYAIYVDGGQIANPGPSAVAAVVVSSSGELIIEQARAIGEATNNMAEYRALLYGISLAHLVGCQRPHFISDSELIVQQVSGFWAIKGGTISALHNLCTSRLYGFDDWSIQHVPRTQNKRADWLVNRLLRGDEHKRTLKNPPVDGLAFRTGRLRAGWVNIGNKQYD